MKGAIYCRVSTHDQREEGTSLETQRAQCLAKARSLEWDVSEAHIILEDWTGVDLQRPGFTKMLDLAKKGEIEGAVFHSLDRVYRPEPGQEWRIFQVLQMFTDAHVQVEFVDSSVPSAGPLSGIFTFLDVWRAGRERDAIKERTMRGKEARLKEGRLPQGTGIGLFGYSWDKNAGRRRILEVEAAIVSRIFEMAIEGKSVHGIAVALNEAGIRTKGKRLWHPLTVKRVLTNRAYTGETYFRQTQRLSKSKVVAQPEENWISLPDVTPPIVDLETFIEAQQAMVRAKESRPLRANAAYLLTGFIRCGKCGHPLGGTTQGGRYRYYKCRGAVPTTTRGKVCDARHVKASEVDEFVWGRLVNLCSSPLTILSEFTDLGYDSSQSVLPMLNRQIKSLTAKLKNHETAEKKLYSLLTHESVTQEFVLEELAKLRERQAEDEAQMSRLVEWRDSETQRLHIPQRLTEVVDALRGSMSEDMKLSERRTILDALQVKVVAVPGKFEFTCFIDAELTGEVNLDNEAAFEDCVREFERAHPKLTFGDLIDHAKRLPEDTVLGRMTNQVKERNLVTIERTWASLREYSHPNQGA